MGAASRSQRCESGGAFETLSLDGACHGGDRVLTGHDTGRSVSHHIFEAQASRVKMLAFSIFNFRELSVHRGRGTIFMDVLARIPGIYTNFASTNQPSNRTTEQPSNQPSNQTNKFAPKMRPRYVEMRPGLPILPDPVDFFFQSENLSFHTSRNSKAETQESFQVVWREK